MVYRFEASLSFQVFIKVFIQVYLEVSSIPTYIQLYLNRVSSIMFESA